MKHGTEYAKRLKRLYQDLLKKYGKPSACEPTDPIAQMVIGLLSLDTSMSKAQSAYRKLVGEMVDLNELRVTPPMEIEEQIDGIVPMASDKARRIVDALNAVRRRQDTLDLEFLKQRSRREAREYLESVEGLVPFVAAQVVLYSLQGHAIPVDNLTLYVLRKKNIVDPDADIPTVQGFLERNINASDAAVFAQLLDRFVTASSGRVDVSELSAILAPDESVAEIPDAEAVAEAEVPEAQPSETSSAAPKAVKTVAHKSAVKADTKTSAKKKKDVKKEAKADAEATSKPAARTAAKSASKTTAKRKESGAAKKAASKKTKPASQARSAATTRRKKK